MAKKREKTMELFPDLTDDPIQPPAIIRTNVPVATIEPARASGDVRGKRVFVIDSHSLIYQVFHAIPDMTSPDGKPVNALFGFIRDILDILSRYRPDFLVCAFDHSETTFRNAIYSAYKANRDPMPEPLREQIPEIHKLLKTMGIPAIDLPGFEADDILATFARELVEAGAEQCVLVTSDKDCRQLITDRVRLLNLRKGNLYGPDELRADWGISPEQVVDFQAMVGDSVDNVPGIPSIGPKTATQLLEQFGNLEQVLARTGEIKGKKAEKIREGAEQVLISRRLVRLDDRVPLKFDWKYASVGQWDVPAAMELCHQFGFRQITDRIAKLGPNETVVDAWKANYRTVTDTAELKAIVDMAIAQGRVSFDTETTSINPNWAGLVGASLCIQPGTAWYIPVRAPEGEKTMDQEELAKTLRPLFDSTTTEMIGQNLKYDMIVMRRCGLTIQCKMFDTMVADYLADPGRNTHNMDELSARFLGHQTTKISELIGRGKDQGRMDEVPVDKITWYAAEDADVPMRLQPILTRHLEAAGLTGLFQDVEMPLVRVLAELEFNGIKVDGVLLGQISQEFGERLKQLQQEIWQLAGNEFNIDSPKQLGDVLFDQLNLKEVRKTKTGRSTDADVLESLADEHPLPKLVIEYRQLAKLKNTYSDALASQINPATGRVHTSFMQDVARTGRLSSKDPNLQNIPVRTAEGRRIRQAFVACDQDHCLLTADWSQIELRVLAHFCQDRVMLEAFRRNEDIHKVVAAEVNGIALDDVTSEMRRKAKATNFGIIYGQSPWGLARELGISKDDATGFIAAYFLRYPAVDGFIREVLSGAAANGYVSTILGRRRPVDGVRDPGTGPISRNRTSSERIALNTVIQGSAADLIKLAMIRIQPKLEASGIRAKMLLQIHDELLFEVLVKDKLKLARLVHDEMTQIGNLAVPLQVSIETGPNWNDTVAVTDFGEPAVWGDRNQ